MSIKLPIEVENFAVKYFAAEDRADRIGADRIQFRKVDQKALALEFKALMDLPIMESVEQLCNDLCAYRPGVSAAAHTYRLKTFAKRYKVKIASRRGRHFTVRSGQESKELKYASAPSPFNFKASMLDTITKALQAGVSLRLVREQSAQVLDETTARIAEETATVSLNAIMQETGMSKAQLVNIVNAI